MFTGIITDLGRVHTWEGGLLSLEFTKAPTCSDYTIGSSIAVDGVCLTVINMKNGSVGFEVMPETVSKTRLQSIQIGDVLNIEFPMSAAARFEGHIVQGHVDGCGKMSSIEEDGNSHILWVNIPLSLSKYLVPKGSVTINGISLTVVEVRDESFSVAIIPHTWEVTNISSLTVGSIVNIEVDVMAKYMERLINSKS